MPGKLSRLPMYGFSAEISELEVFYLRDVNDRGHLDLF